jgi:rubrerythrin
VALEGWEEDARRREREEVAWYENALEEIRDRATRSVLTEILESERHHLAELGGKWMAASPPEDAEEEST